MLAEGPAGNFLTNSPLLGWPGILGLVPTAAKNSSQCGCFNVTSLAHVTPSGGVGFT